MKKVNTCTWIERKNKQVHITMYKYKNKKLITRYFSNISSSLSDSGNYTEAIKYYDRALAIDLFDTNTLVKKGSSTEFRELYSSIKYYDEA